MNTRIILPYDGGALAQIALRRAAAFALSDPLRPSELVLAVPGAPGDSAERWCEQARVLIGARLPLSVAFLRHGDEHNYLSLLLECNPRALLAFPVCSAAVSHWYADTLSNRAGHPLCDTLVLLIGPEELRHPVRGMNDGRSGLGRTVRGLVRARPRLHPGVRPHVGAARSRSHTGSA